MRSKLEWGVLVRGSEGFDFVVGGFWDRFRLGVSLEVGEGYFLRYICI